MSEIETSPGGEAHTAWRFGRFDGRPSGSRLLFGRMFEDAAIEQGLFPSGSRVFCIASAGCTALALAKHGCHVTAVDINPSQIAYVARRLAGGPPERGSADRVLAIVRRAVRLFGVRRQDLEAFVEMNDPNEQLRFWRERMDRPALRRAVQLLLGPATLRLAYAHSFVRSLPPQMGKQLLSRIERGIGLHPNRTNPFAAPLFLGKDSLSSSAPIPPLDSLDIVCADAADFLEQCPAGTFHGFALSNILDGAGRAYADRLWRAVRHAASFDAQVIVRSFAEPQNDEERTQAAADRSFLWGRVSIRRFDEISDPR